MSKNRQTPNIITVNPIAKRYPLLKEGRFVQFATEMFNAFNHTQWAGVDPATYSNPAKPTDPMYGTKTCGQGKTTNSVLVTPYCRMPEVVKSQALILEANFPSPVTRHENSRHD
jgi:hypothetical protein